MKKWLIGAAVAGGVAWLAYDFSQSRYLDAPITEGDDFVMVFGEKNDGLRGVVTGLKDERPERKYFSYNADNVPDWYLESWSTCSPPSDEERASFLRGIDLGPGGRLDAVCKIDADGDIFVRGWIASVPNV